MALYPSDEFAWEIDDRASELAIRRSISPRPLRHRGSRAAIDAQRFQECRRRTATEECLGSKADLRTIFAGIPPGLRQALLIHSDLPGPNPNIKQT